MLWVAGWLGGVGAAMIRDLPDGAPGRRAAVLGLPTAFIPQGSPSEIHHRLGLDAEGLAGSCLDLLG